MMDINGNAEDGFRIGKDGVSFSGLGITKEFEITCFYWEKIAPVIVFYLGFTENSVVILSFTHKVIYQKIFTNTKSHLIRKVIYFSKVV